MIITCPACATQFRVPDGALGSDGRKLRCSSCRHVWFEAPPALTEESPGAEAEAPDTIAPPPPSPTAPEPEAAAPEAESATHEEAFIPPVPSGPETAAEDEEPSAPAQTVAEETEPLPEAETEAVTIAESEARDAVSEVEVETEAEEEAVAPAPAAPAGTTGWEPGAVMPRMVKSEAADETPRSGLRLVPRDDKPGDAAPAPTATEKAPATGPSFDINRVVAPDSAPAEPRREKPRRRRSGRILVLLLLVAAVAGAYFERTQVMRFVPQTATLYGLVGLVGAPSAQGLQILDVTYSVEEVGGTLSLIVSGKVMNVGRDYRLIPELRVALYNAEGAATEIWALRTTAEGLAPGATTVFEAVYPDPPRTGTDTHIGLTFADLI